MLESAAAAAAVNGVVCGGSWFGCRWKTTRPPPLFLPLLSPMLKKTVRIACRGGGREGGRKASQDTHSHKLGSPFVRSRNCDCMLIPSSSTVVAGTTTPTAPIPAKDLVGWLVFFFLPLGINLSCKREIPPLIKRTAKWQYSSKEKKGRRRRRRRTQRGKKVFSFSFLAHQQRGCIACHNALPFLSPPPPPFLLDFLPRVNPLWW